SPAPSRQGHAVRVDVRGRDVSPPPRGPAVPVLPRVDALVPAGATGEAVGRGDGLGPVRPAQLPAGDGKRGRRPGRPRTRRRCASLRPMSSKDRTGRDRAWPAHTVHLGRYTRVHANAIAGELEKADIGWWYKEPSWLSTIWEFGGVRLFVDRDHLAQAKEI